MNLLSYIQKNQNELKRRSTLIAILMQTGGIRFFQGLGFILLSYIIIINIRSFKEEDKKALNKFLCLYFIWLFLAIYKDFSFSYMIDCSMAMFSAFFASLTFLHKNKSVFFIDLYAVLKLFSIQAFISIIILVIIPESWLSDTNQIITHHTFLNIFYYTGTPVFEKITRIPGLFWEPGCMQMIANLFLCMSIIKKKNISKLLWIIFLIICTGSTAGYIILSINACFLLFIYPSKKIIKYIPFIALVSFLSIPIIIDNITDKTGGENSSGIIRQRDFLIGLDIIKNHPFIGANPETLSVNKDVQKVEDMVWDMTTKSKDWVSNMDYLAGGYTNGLMGVFINWGLLGGLIIYIYCIRTPLLNNDKYKVLFLLVIFCSMTSEPISNTSFFYLFVTSYFSKKSNKLPRLSKKRIYLK